MAQVSALLLRTRRSVMKVFFRSVFRILFRIKISGRENVPRQGAYLICHNHVSILEPALLLAFWKTQPEALGAAELWHRPGQSLAVRLYKAIPVQRGDYERSIFNKVIANLKTGKPMLIAPEGTRSHVPGMQRAEPGVAYLVEHTRVPVLPVAIIGTTDANLRAAFRLARPELRVIIGEPFTLPELAVRGKDRRLSRQENADRVMQRIAALLPEEYRGVYGSAIHQRA